MMEMKVGAVREACIDCIESNYRVPREEIEEHW
jgi:hypothetical protein